MPNDAFQAFIRVFLGLGLFITLCSVITIFFQPRDSAEFVLSVCNIFIGLGLILVVVVFIRFFKPPA